jgi:hypothetical protein
MSREEENEARKNGYSPSWELVDYLRDKIAKLELGFDQEATAPVGCDTGTMINQNLPTAMCSVGHRVDHTLPPGTLEVWQHGKRIGRIENIGLNLARPASGGTK